VDTLLDSILILSEMNEYKANPNRLAVGVVLESGVEKGFGVFANLLIQNGTLKRGDLVISGSSYGKVKAMFNENKVAINEALPSMPIKMFGLDTVPNAGNKFLVSKNEADIKEIANIAKNVIHNEELNNNFNQSQTDGDVFHIIIKVDVMGSMQAIKKLLSAIEIEGVKLNLAKCGIGAITESDIQLAKITKSPIIGFNVKPMSNIREMAKSNDIDILFYDIIYKLADDVVEMMKGTLKPVYEEVETGEALVQQI
jgi:translation initiation factor IF-2